MEKHTKIQEKKRENYNYNDLPFWIQKSYTENQDDAWRTYLKGGKGPKGFSDRLMRAQNNIDFSIELLTYLVSNNLLDEERKSRLRKIYIS